MKSFLFYLLFVGTVLGGTFGATHIIYPEAFKPASAQAKSHPAPRIVAKTDTAAEPVVDPNDPDLFDARGKFPQAMRDAMARAKRDSTQNFAVARAEQIRTAKENKARATREAQRRVRKQHVPPSSLNAYAELPRLNREYARQQESWNTGGFGFGF